MRAPLRGRPLQGRGARGRGLEEAASGEGDPGRPLRAVEEGVLVMDGRSGEDSGRGALGRPLRGMGLGKAASGRCSGRALGSGEHFELFHQF